MYKINNQQNWKRETENKNTEPVSPRVKSKSPVGGGQSSQSNWGIEQSRGGGRGGKSR